MRVFANGTLENGGNTIGVIPYFLKTKEISSDALTNLIVTNNMHDRKVIMNEKSDEFIIILGVLAQCTSFSRSHLGIIKTTHKTY